MSQEAKLRGALRAKWKQNALTIPVSQLLSVLLHIGTSNSKIGKKLQNKICLMYMLAAAHKFATFKVHDLPYLIMVSFVCSRELQL